MRTDIFLGTIEIIMKHMTLDEIRSFNVDIDNYKDYFVPKNYKDLKDLINEKINVLEEKYGN